METTFRLSAIRNLILRDLFMGRSQALIGLAVMTGIVLINGIASSTLKSIPENSIDQHTSNYLIWFFILGVAQTAGSFREFAQVGTLQDYLLLPASSLEKWAARWLRTLPLYILGFSVAYTLVALLLQLILFLSGNHDVPFFHPFQPEILDAWKSYLILHALFFTGALQFNRMPIPKTLLTLAISGMGFLIATLTVVYLIAGPNGSIDRSIQMEGDFVGISGFWAWVIYSAITLFLWFVSFLKLTEKEV